MSVTAARGFEAAGVAAGLRSTGAPDVALVVNRGPRSAVAAVFTSNRSKANPILWSEQAIAQGVASAIVLNAGGANCFTGDEGFQTARATAQAVGAALGAPAEHVQVCSTGLIGDVLDRNKVLAGVADALATLDARGGTAAARAILTTDTVEKLSVHEGARSGDNARRDDHRRGA